MYYLAINLLTHSTHSITSFVLLPDVSSASLHPSPPPLVLTSPHFVRLSPHRTSPLGWGTPFLPSCCYDFPLPTPPIPPPLPRLSPLPPLPLLRLPALGVQQGLPPSLQLRLALAEVLPPLVLKVCTNACKNDSFIYSSS